MIIKKFLSILICAGIAHIQPVFASDLIQMSSQQIKSLHIVVAKPVAIQQQTSTPFAGKITIPQSQIKVVSASAMALIKSLNVNVEDYVKKGQSLGSIQSADLISSQSGFLQNQAKLDIAKKNMNRDAQLYKEGIISERRYQESVALYKELSAVQQEKVQLMRLHGVSASKNGMSSNAGLIAPIDGVVIEQNAQVGQRVDSTTVIYKIAKLSPLWAEVQVPVSIAQNLTKGDEIHIKSSSVAGKVILISKNINPTTQTVLVRAELKDTASLKPNQQIEAEIKNNLTSQQFQIPNSAIVYKGQSPFVFAQRQSGFEAIPVKVISQNQKGLIVSGSIKTTDSIAVQGVSAIKGSWLGFGGE